MTYIHLDQEGGKPLQRGLAPEKQQMIFGVAQMIGCHKPHLARGFHIALSHGLDLTALEKENLAFGDRLSRQVMLLAEFKAKKLARKIKFSNLGVRPS